MVSRRRPNRGAVGVRTDGDAPDIPLVGWGRVSEPSPGPPIRVLVAKPGLDGHDRGAKVIARALRDAGMEVVYAGLRQSPEQIVNAATQEDVEFIGLSILSGAHMAIVPRVLDLLQQAGGSDIRLVIGGIIPDADVPVLEGLGVARIFQTGVSLESIVTYLQENRPQRTGV